MGGRSKPRHDVVWTSIHNAQNKFVHTSSLVRQKSTNPEGRGLLASMLARRLIDNFWEHCNVGSTDAGDVGELVASLILLFSFHKT